MINDKAGLAMLTIARLTFGLFFAGSAILKIWQTDLLAGFLIDAGFENPNIWVYVAAFCQALAGGALLANRGVRVAALGLVAYVAVVNYFLHPFWVLSGEEWSIQFQLFSKNLGIMAGLLTLAGATKDWSLWPKN